MVGRVSIAHAAALRGEFGALPITTAPPDDGRWARLGRRVKATFGGGRRGLVGVGRCLLPERCWKVGGSLAGAHTKDRELNTVPEKTVWAPRQRQLQFAKKQEGRRPFSLFPLYAERGREGGKWGGTTREPDSPIFFWGYSSR